MAIENVKNSMSLFELVQQINANFGELDSLKQAASALGTAAFKNVAAGTGTSADSGKIVLLGADGKLPSLVVGDLFSSEQFVSATKAGLTSLSSAKSGDWGAVTADESHGGSSTLYVLFGEYGTLANWKEVTIPCSVVSVNGKTGAVTIGIADISGLQTALDGKLNTSGNGSNVTVAFTQAATSANIATGETLATICGKLSKIISSLGAMAYKANVGTSDFASGAKAPNASLADTATTAGKVGHTLTLNVGGTNSTFDGSANVTVNLSNTTQETFTASDARWATITNGFKLSITTTKKLIGSVCKLNSNTQYEEVCAGVEYGSSALYIYSNEKFAGCVYLI